MGQQSRSSLEQVCQLNVEVLGEPGGCAAGVAEAGAPQQRSCPAATPQPQQARPEEYLELLGGFGGSSVCGLVWETDCRELRST